MGILIIAVYLETLLTQEQEADMKTVIVYFSQHHGNTKKLLDAHPELSSVEIRIEEDM